MNPRCILLAAWLLAFALPASAQAPARIAYIMPGGVAGSADRLAAFKQGMRENGMVEGTHYVLDEHYAQGRYERFKALTDEAIKNRPALIVVNTIASVRAAQQATKTIPIVFVSTNDPVGSGLVASLARPGGNTTGLSSQNEDLVTKYVELLHETLPHAKRVAVLSNPGNPSNAKMFEQVRVSAGTLGIAARLFEAGSPEILDTVFAAVVQHRADALLILPDATFFDQKERISTFALWSRIPAFAPGSEFLSSGSLIAFGTLRRELWRRSATYVKKILGGTKPADLPVEQPTRFELAVNLKAAKQLNITIPYSVMVRAEVVIQ